MSKKLYFLISLVLVLSLTSAGYSYSEHLDAFIMLDFNHNAEPNDVNTEPGWDGFVIDDSGTEVNDVDGNPSGVTVDLDGVRSVNIESARRNDPNSENHLVDLGGGNDANVAIAKEEMYRDFIYGLGENNLDITLWGLGAERKVKIYIYAYDDSSTNNRIANWTNNGDYLLTTDFIGGDTDTWPIDPNDTWAGLFSDKTYYDFNAITYADDLGRIHLTCTEDPCNEEDPFAFANGLVIVTYGTPNDVLKAHRPIPKDGKEDVSIHPTLTWWPGAGATSHQVYMGTDPNSLSLVASPTAASYTPSDFLTLDQTYYWRVDELPGPVTGDVWSFTTANNHLVEDFEAYSGGNPIYQTWCQWQCNGSSAEVYTSLAPAQPAIDEKGMEYDFMNSSYDPYYSEAWVELDDIGMDNDFVSMNVQALSIMFYGVAGNPITEQMYAILSDGTKTAKLDYPGDMNAIQQEEWQQWNISIPALLDVCDVDLSNVSYVGIGFAEGAPADGTVYFDDLRVYTTRCVPSECSELLSRADYAPVGNLDCVVDNLEVEVMARDWLATDYATDTCEVLLTDPNLVLYLPFDDFNDANGQGGFVLPQAIKDFIFYNDGVNPHSESNDLNGVIVTKNMAPSPHPNATYAILSPIDPCDDTRESPVGILSPGVPIEGKTGGHCIHFEADQAEPGERVHCGRWQAVGNFDRGDPVPVPDTEQMGYQGKGDITLAIWAKWAGPKIRPKCQGLISKRLGWDESGEGVIFMFECDTVSAPRGSISLRQRHSPWSIWSSAGLLDMFIGQWIHLAAVAHATEDSNDCTLYLNGAEVLTGPFYFGGGDPYATTMTIGQISDLDEQSIENFHGELDEAYVFNRALDPNEVAYLADLSPGDGVVHVPVASAAEIYNSEPKGQQILNFKDFAWMADQWLKKEYWP